VKSSLLVGNPLRSLTVIDSSVGASFWGYANAIARGTARAKHNLRKGVSGLPAVFDQGEEVLLAVRSITRWWEVLLGGEEVLLGGGEEVPLVVARKYRR